MSYSDRDEIAKLDQHLLSTSAAAEVVAVAGIAPEDVVLDIGAGAGALTATALCCRPQRIYAVEIDRRFSSRLDPLARRHRCLRLLWIDLRDLDPLAFTHVTVVVSNPPFSLLAPVVSLLGRLPMRRAVVVVGDRWATAAVARPGSEEFSLTSLAVQSRFAVQVVGRIGGDRFVPAVAGETAILRFTPLAAKDVFMSALCCAVENHAGMRVKTFLRRSRLYTDPVLADRAARVYRHPEVRAIQQRRLVSLRRHEISALAAAIVEST